MSRPGTKNKPSQTALLTAFYRSVGNQEYNLAAVGSDYLAKHFLPLFLKFLIKNRTLRMKGVKKFSKRMPGVFEYVLARTAFFDDIFIEALDRKLTQIVFLGAGYDTRAYRYANSNAESKIIELDDSDTQRRKIQHLKKHHIETDARQPMRECTLIICNNWLRCP